TDEKLLAGNNKIIKTISNLNTNAYAAGALEVKTKELLGLVASEARTIVVAHLKRSYDYMEELEKQVGYNTYIIFSQTTLRLSFASPGPIAIGTAQKADLTQVSENLYIKRYYEAKS